MRRNLKVLALILALFCCGKAQSYQLKQIRSLSAAGSIQNGIFFDGVNAPLAPQGGGNAWTVVLTGSAPTLSYQIQVQMTDGTWVPISPSNGAAAGPGSTVVLAGAFAVASGQCFTFPGPF